MNGIPNPQSSDLDKLSRIKGLAWLLPAELSRLAGVLTPVNFKRSQVILDETAQPGGVNIILRGIARVTCRNVRNQRVMVALLPPGFIPQFPALPPSRFDFRCEAYDDCRVGGLSWNDFSKIALTNSQAMLKKIHEHDLQQWYRILLRGCGSLNLGLHERIAITLRELCADFGVSESRGALLRVPVSHQDIADLVGASRPRVTEHLAQLEREHLIIRQDRYFIVCDDVLGSAATMAPAVATDRLSDPFKRSKILAGPRKTKSDRSEVARAKAMLLVRRTAHGKTMLKFSAGLPTGSTGH